MFRVLSVVLIATLTLFSLKIEAQQTPPVQPNTQPVPMPPPVTLPPPPALPADVPNRPLTADEAVRIALLKQPNVTVARSGIAAAQGRTEQVRSGLLPTLGVSTGYTTVQTLAGEGSPAGTGGGGTNTGTPTTNISNSTGLQASVTLRQLLFDFNHTRDLVRQAAALETAASANLTRVQYDLVLQVKQAFYNILQSDRLVAVSQSNLANRQSQLTLAQARLNSGLGLPSDVAQAQTQVAAGVLSLNVAQNNANQARVTLALTMGIDPRTPIQVTDMTEPPVPTNDVNALVTTALRQRPEILQAQATLRSNRYAVSAARTTSAPAISASVGLSTRGDQFFPGNDFFSAGLVIQWTPFDAGLTAGRVKEARANVESALAQLTGAQLTVQSDVSQAYLNLRSAEQRVSVADAEVANAQEGLRIAQGRYERGLGLFQDILTAQASLFTALTDQVNARYAVDQARAALSRAIGTPLGR